MAEVNSIATFDRPPVIERLHSNVGKRKSTTPQKFVGGYLKIPVFEINDLSETVFDFFYQCFFFLDM